MNRVTDAIAIRQSRIWQTNTGIVETGDSVILVDPGIFADELDALVESLHGRPIIAGFATHWHWDHILWTPNLGAAPRYASAETCERVMGNIESLARSIDDFEREFGPQWDRSGFFDIQPIPIGPGTIAGLACELVPIPGHADGQVALVLPDHEVAFVADTLSDVEVPSLEEGEGQRERYLETLDRLSEVIERVAWVIPGHGLLADRSEAHRRLDLDRRYLEALPGMIAAAPAAQSDDDLARSILASLDETRVSKGMSWQMHVENIRMLRNNR